MWRTIVVCSRHTALIIACGIQAGFLLIYGLPFRAWGESTTSILQRAGFSKNAFATGFSPVGMRPCITDFPTRHFSRFGSGTARVNCVRAMRIAIPIGSSITEPSKKLQEPSRKPQGSFQDVPERFPRGSQE